MMRENDGDRDCEREKGSRPRRDRQLPLKGVDDSQESPVDDSDNDSNYKFVDEESSKDDNSEADSDNDMPDRTTKKTKATEAKST